MKRVLIAATVAASFFATNLIAAEAGAPLAPGKPSGVKQAQSWDLTTIGIVGGTALVAVALGLSTGQADRSQAINTAPTPSAVTT